MHERTATLSGNLPAMLRALESLDADLAEVRLDSLWPEPPREGDAIEALLALTDAATVPLLATLRPKRQGGAYEGPEDIRLNLLAAAAKAGFAEVDLEADLAELAGVSRILRDDARITVSDHGMPAAPSRDAGVRELQAMQDLHTHRQKIAYPSGSFLDELRALELCFAHAERNGEPAIAPMGTSPAFRALLPLAGNQRTYAHVGAEAFPGQPSLADLEATWKHWGLEHDELGGRDGWYAVLGDPVEHSLSPRIHNAALRHAGRTPRYGALRVPDSIGAVRLLTGVATRIGLRGASVTMPLKHHAAQACDGDASVQAIGAANCFRFDDPNQKAPATNTDASALRRLLEGAQHVAVIGAGGAGRAALWAAKQVGADTTLVARPGDRADRAATDFDVPAVWSARDRIEADAWVQATPLGMHGEASPVARVEGIEQAIELVYAAGPTGFEALAQSAGAKVTDGRTFLIEQAVDAYHFWTGDAPERSVMEAVL